MNYLKIDMCNMNNSTNFIRHNINTNNTTTTSKKLEKLGHQPFISCRVTADVV